MHNDTLSTPRFVAIACALTIASSTQLTAQVVTPNPNLPVLYPPAYSSNLAGIGPVFNGPGLTIALTNFEQRVVSIDNRIFSGGDEIEIFQSLFLGNVSVNSSPFQPASGSGPVQTITFGKVGNLTGVFNTEMLSMSLSGTSPFGPFMIRESPTLASTGQTSITDLHNGNFSITSFFDIFTELSVDGGATWLPATSSVRMDLEQVPEPSTSALLLLGVISFRVWSRRRA